MSEGGREMDEGEGDSRKIILDQDRFLPIANVSRIMKREIPGGGKVAKEAKECVQECVSEFISFIASEASERCQSEKRKTINGEDVLNAMNTLGFDAYMPALRAYMGKYRDAQKGEKGSGVETSEADQAAPVIYIDPSQFTQPTTQPLVINPNGTLQFLHLIQPPASIPSTTQS